MRIAAQIYSVRDEITADFEGTVRQLKNMGYEGIEIPDLYGQTPEKIKDICDRVGIIPMAFTSGLDMFKSNPEEIIRICKILGCEYTCIPYLPPETFTEDNIDAIIADMKKICKKMSDAGLTMMYHNHSHEFGDCRGQYIIDYFLNEIGTDLLKPEFDLGWVHVGGADPVGYVYDYADITPCLHVKNYAGTLNTRTFEFRPVGYGKVDWMPVVGAMLETKTEWLIVEQDAPSLGKTPLECMQMSINYLRPIVPVEK